MKRASNEYFISELFFFAKLGIISVATLQDYKVGGVYFLVCAITALIFRQPRLAGKSNFIKIKTVTEFKMLVEKNNIFGSQNKKKKDSYEDKDMWFVEFYSEYADICNSTKAIWNEFSMKYQTKRLRFGEVSLDKVPFFSTQFKIDKSSFSNQLPTLILFEDGKEVKRFPPIEINQSKIFKQATYDKKILCSFFELENRYLATRDLE